MAPRHTNIFALLDSDDEDVTKVSQASKSIQQTSSKPVALNKPAAGNKRKETKPSPVADTEKNKEKSDRDPVEGKSYGNRGRGGRGGRGGRREFDKKSGTGRGRESRKHGSGAQNWGNPNDTMELVAEAQIQDNPHAVSGEEDANAAATEDQAEAASPEEEEEVQLTLDEYLEMKKSGRTGELFAEQEERQVTEDFSKAVQIVKEGKTPNFIESQYEKVFSKKTSGRKKQLVTDLGFQAPPSERERRFHDDDKRGRGGGRGRGRGRSTSGRGRGGRFGSAPNVSDMHAFPALN